MIPAEPIDNSKQQESSAATTFLLRILTDEIARDGGACLVTTLKEYIIDVNGPKEPLEIRSTSKFCYKSRRRRNQQLNSLLTNSNVGKPKLLAFLESHPEVFEVKREQIPHWVQLVTSTIPIPTNCDLVDDAQRERLRAGVFQRALYVLRKRTARIERRRKENPGSLNEEVDTGVFCHWLLRQCSWDFHFLLRCCGFYLDPSLSGYQTPGDVKQVGSRGWEDVVLLMFQELLRLGRELRRDSEFPIIDWIRVEDGKALLQHSCSEKEYLRQVEIDANCSDRDTRFDFIVQPSVEARGIIRPDSSNELEKAEDENKDETMMLNLVRRIDESLTDIICRKDGGHQVSLQLVLHRYPEFRELLGGRDLWTLYRDFSSHEDTERSNATGAFDADNKRTFFGSVSMFYNGGNIILRSKKSKTIASVDDSLRDKRMMVDEEGLYSVTNNKWGRAMSNLIIQACKQKNLFGRLAIDLTASVGGMTLALAKSNFFNRVLALEIDEGRAALCRKNLNRHGFPPSSKTPVNGPVVDVCNQDSVKQIPSLPRGSCFVIDPPWGGYDYKAQVRRQQQDEGRPLLKLGDTSLEDVLTMISLHNSPCVVGLRLPTNFAANDFLKALRESHEGVGFECLRLRKISVQLFVVLYFPVKRAC